MVSVAFVARGELTDGLGTHCRDSQRLSGTGQADSGADGGARGDLGGEESKRDEERLKGRYCDAWRRRRGERERV